MPMFDRQGPSGKSVAAVICSALTILGVYVFIYSFMWNSWMTQLEKGNATLTPERENATLIPKEQGQSDAVILEYPEDPGN